MDSMRRLAGEQRAVLVRVARQSDIAEGTVKAVPAGNRVIALYRVGGKIYATDAKCTHANVDLSEGRIVGGLIQCPLHVAHFDIASGKGMGPPITRNLKTYPVTLDGDDILVALSEGKT